ncbi:hypothetical protein Tco_0371878 [Tanacetum coccineum]
MILEPDELPSNNGLDFRARRDDGRMYSGHIELTTGCLIDVSPCGGIDIVLKDLDLKPKIDAMMRDFLDFIVLHGGKNWAMKRVVRFSQAEMDPAGRR